MFLDFVHRLMFIKNTTFRKLDLFPSSGKIMAAPTLLGPLEITSLNHCTILVRRSKTYKHLGSGFCQQEIIGNYTIKIKRMYIKT
jgi:hypothetical protein